MSLFFFLNLSLFSKYFCGFIGAPAKGVKLVFGSGFFFLFFSFFSPSFSVRRTKKKKECFLLETEFFPIGQSPVLPFLSFEEEN